MDAFFGFLLLVAVLAGVFIVVRFFWRIFVGLLRMGTTPVSRPQGSPQRTAAMSAEEEGNVHSGPHGYSPNTAYPETQYGSGFNPDAEWNHEEE